MKLLVSLSLFAFFFLNCTKEQGEKSGRVLKICNDAEPQSIDPHKCTGHPGIRIIGGLFEGLVIRDLEKGSVRPGLAKSWDISEDGTHYTFHLRQSKWSNGSPLTASDFVSSWQRFLNPKTGAEYASLLNIVKNGSKVINGIYPPDSLGVSAPNDSTFEVQLVSPIGYFLQLCAFEPLFPVPVSVINEAQEKWTSAQNIIGNGPYILKEWVPNKIMQLEKNPNYWDAASVKQERVEVKPIEDQETAYKMFLSGELDWIFSIPLSKMEVVKKNPKFINFTQYGVYYYSLNVTDPVLKNKDLRKALSYSINRQKIVELVTKGNEMPASGFVPVINNIPYAGVDLKLYSPQKAREYLKKAGFGPGKKPPTLEILYNNSESHKKIAEVISQMWKEELGIEVALKNYEWKIYLQSTKNLEHQVARASWFADYPDPYSFLELGVSHNGNNRSGYKSPNYDACLDGSQKILDSEARMAKLAECESILMEDMPVIPIYYYSGKELRHPGIKGAIPNPMGMYSWKDVYIE